MELDARNIGTLLGCVEMGIAPSELAICSGLARAWDQNGEPAQRLIVKSAHDLMVVTGHGHTAPAIHLRLVVESPEWSPHSREVAEHVVHTLMANDQLEKMASGVPSVISGGGDILKALGYGSLGVGAGLGGLYYLLSRHANQEEADTEAKKHQVDHYDRLARELNESLRRKYRYTPS